jgi:hypothetical protein
MWGEARISTDREFHENLATKLTRQLGQARMKNNVNI